LAQLQRLVITSDQFDQTMIILTPEQQHYLNRVLRLKSGDRFIAMNGQGQSWLAELRSNQATVIESVNTSSELTISVTLMLALPKGNAFDEVVRQVTELGVSCIAPVISDRTLLQPSANKLDRWRRIAQEAAEQSERQIVPTLLDPVPFTDALETLTAEQKFFCAARGSSPHLLQCLSNPKSSILVAIGCEGGWTNPEIDQAISAGYQTVSLGKRILRAVTAPIVALSLIAAKAEESSHLREI
jgi:16S rRNA (uracil1498-N3)-methyltransferase